MWLSTSAGRRSRTDRSPNAHSRSTSESNSRPTSPSTLLAETLRRNPFRTPPKEQSTTTGPEAEVRRLNQDLYKLASFYPDVQIEVLRELLKRFDGESRLPICVEQLYKYKTEWARGRLQTPPREDDETIPLEERFRSKAYTAATTRTLAAEFKSINKSQISGVLAEVNDSYSEARPILWEIANRSRWSFITNALSWKKKKGIEEAPAALFEKSRGDINSLRLTSTGSAELDLELSKLFVNDDETRLKETREKADLAYAEELNRQEAEEAEALFECQVCYNDVPFENISTCSTDAHVVCLDCVRRTLQEALFGQGWNKSIDTRVGTLRCLSSADSCPGHIPQPLVQRTILALPSGETNWLKFEQYLALDSLAKSAIPLVRCPFCTYAEVDTVHTATSARSLRWRFRRPSTVPLVIILLFLELLPAIFCILIPIFLLFPNLLKGLFYTALAHISSGQRSIRFVCLNPACGRKSCTMCSKPWHDPHTCHEPLILSLRQSVEAARTAAVKRTCPRCGTSFVKSSGCNKLTCVCGYAMCYLCRANIGKSGAAGNAEGAEGYRHFCEHFRPNPGQQCTECTKCDLYKSVDEEAAVRRAGDEAERRWRAKEGVGRDQKGLEEAIGKMQREVGGGAGWWFRFVHGEWTVQGVVDGVVEQCVVLENPD